MQLEFHQLDRRWEHLRVRHPAWQRRLLASLAETGQQTLIVVVAAEGQPERYLVIDGYKRIAALAQLGRDTGLRLVAPPPAPFRAASGEQIAAASLVHVDDPAWRTDWAVAILSALSRHS